MTNNIFNTQNMIHVTMLISNVFKSSEKDTVASEY